MVPSGTRIPFTGESGFPVLKKMRNAVKKRLRGLVTGRVPGEQKNPGHHEKGDQGIYPSGEKRRETDSLALIHRDRFR
jgi:hypothetical protein